MILICIYGMNIYNIKYVISLVEYYGGIVKIQSSIYGGASLQK